jgi:glycerophosphoryl diester phosphodiesterase
MPELIAHRGYRAHYPENTLLALEAALSAGPCDVEFDVQLTADGIPVVFHDVELERTTGAPGSLLDSELADLFDLSPREPERFGPQFEGVLIPTLEAALELLARYPKRRAFVEIKEESLERFGVEDCLSPLLSLLEPCADQLVLISYSPPALNYAREHSPLATGWVLTEYDDEHRRQAEALAPAYLICNQKRLPQEHAPWDGPWRWMAYEVNEIAQAESLIQRGVEAIETAEVERLLASGLFGDA